MSLEEQRQLLLKAGWSAISKDQTLKDAVVALFKQMGQETCSTCPSVLYNRYITLKHMSTLNNITPMSERKIILKGESFTVRPNGPTYLKNSITDDEALALIKQNPDRAQSFDIKGNLDDLMKDYEKRLVKGNTDEPVKQAQAEEAEAAKIEAEIAAEEEAKKASKATAKKGK